MAKKKVLALGDKYAGVDIAYTKATQEVTLSGWYDTHAGIAPQTVTLTHLLRALNITVEDCRKALDK